MSHLSMEERILASVRSSEKGTDIGKFLWDVSFYSPRTDEHISEVEK